VLVIENITIPRAMRSKGYKERMNIFFSSHTRPWFVSGKEKEYVVFLLYVFCFSSNE
jgi:hypothetical protein